MSNSFIKRDLLIKVGNDLHHTSVSISKPIAREDGLYSSAVEFSGLDKYSAQIRGMDEFNAIECALDYVEGIFRNSKDPEFFLDEEESLLRD